MNTVLATPTFLLSNLPVAELAFNVTSSVPTTPVTDGLFLVKVAVVVALYVLF